MPVLTDLAGNWPLEEAAPLWTDRWLGWTKNSNSAPAGGQDSWPPGVAAMVILRLGQMLTVRSRFCALLRVPGLAVGMPLWHCPRPYPLQVS